MKITGFYPFCILFLLWCGAGSGAEWRPEANASRVGGGLRLGAAVVVEQGKRLVVAERLGGKTPPYRSRMVCFELDGGKVTATPVVNADVVSLRETAGGKLWVGCLEDGADGEKISYRVWSEDGVWEKAEKLVLPFRSAVALAPGGSRFFWKCPGEKKIQYCSTENLAERNSFLSEAAGGVLAAADDGTLYEILPEAGKIVKYGFSAESGGFSGKTIYPGEGSFELVADGAVILPIAGTDELAAADSRDCLWQFSPGEGRCDIKDREIIPQTLGAVKLADGKWRLFYVRRKLDTLVFRDSPGGDKAKMMPLRRLKPYDHSEIQYAALLPDGGVVVLDRKGQISRIELSAKGKWSKKLLYPLERQ